MMRDFHQCRPEQIKSETLSKAVAYYKEKEGRGAMSEAVRQYAMEYAKEYAKEYGEEQKQEGIQTGVVQRYIYLYRMEITLYKEVLKKPDYRLKSSKNQ